MKRFSFKAALCAAVMLAAALGQPAAAAVDPAQQSAPADGWASQGGGTFGGSAATAANIYTVTKRSELLAAILNGGTNPKIIKVVGIIDMSDGVPYTTTSDQAARGSINLKSNTTLIGDGSNSGIVNGAIVLTNVSQIIIRNLKFINPCDVGPIWDPTDGSTGNWNAAYDAIGIKGSDHIWIDHNSFTDLPVTDDFLPIENGHIKQCHDGAVDITNASDYVTVSYNVFGQHDKNNLIGSSDSATADEGKLRVTFSNNVFRDIQSRAPRVRYGQVHLFNNYYAGSKSASVYANSYSVGAGANAKILSNANVFDIAGAVNCDAVVSNMGSTSGTFKDSGSTLNGAALGACTVPNTASWTPPYTYSVRPIALVKANALAQAGGGKLSTAVSGSGVVTVPASATLTCPTSGLYFCDDFQNGSSSNWDLLPLAGANGNFSVIAETVGSDNKVLQYSANTAGGILALVKPAAFAGVPSGDYYVEARIRPMTNGTTGNKLLYLVARYVDASNWYGAGLNVQSSTGSTQVEIAKMQAGTLTRPGQVKAPINMDAQFYTVRFEMIGSTLTVYLDGVPLKTLPPDTTFSARGLIGLYTANKSFMIDDIRVGDPSQKPVQLTINPSNLTYAAEANDAPYAVTVNAKTSSGQADSFTAVSSNPAVVSVAIVGNVVNLTPVGAGTANIVFTSGSDVTLTRTIAATIQPQFIQPTQIYQLQGATAPAVLDAAVNIDSSLKLTFDSPPTLGTGATIRIYRKSDDAVVDVIKTAGETDALGYAGQTTVRVVNTTPIKIVGNTVTIKPHTGKLSYGTEYYVAIANGVFNNTSLGGTPFVGIGKVAGWSFTTAAAPATNLTTLTVDDDGAADFRTVQGALNYAMKNIATTTPVTINVKNGNYEELLYLFKKDSVTIKGESRDGVMISYTNNEALNSGTGAGQASTATGVAGGRAVMLVESSDSLTLDTLSIKNTTIRSASSGQAETLYYNVDAGRLMAKNASFYSEQDTLNLKGWNWFYNTLVAGNVDFIWGGSHAALFEQSEIRSLGDSASASSGGYVVQARVPAQADRGFVFLNSTLTHGPGPGALHSDVPAGATYLARSPGGTTTWDNVAYVNCKMDSHVNAAGWAGLGVNGQPAPNPTVATAAAGWREYGSTDLAGTPLNLGLRVGGFLLSDTDVASKFATRALVFSQYSGGWNPQP